MSVDVVYLGAERAFRLSDLVTDSEHVTGSIPTGPWLADRHGTPILGALGVLVDDVLGYSLNRIRSEGRWSVSSEISIDVVHPLDVGPAAGPLRATTVGPVVMNGLGAQAFGTITDGRGGTLAHASQRGRWIPFDGDFAAHTPPADDLGAQCLEDLLGGTPSPVEGGAVLRLTVGPVLANPLGNLHGGLSLCASDLVAAAAVRTWDTPWTTESLRIQYLRPVPAGSAVEFTAVVRHAGRSRAVVEVAGTVSGRLCTLAQVSGRPGAAHPSSRATTAP